jgi:hypothetical protein
MEPEQIIANFLRPPGEGGAYTDEKLAALLAHAEDGKLSFMSCCCFAGVPSAQHSLRGYNEDSLNEDYAAGHDASVDNYWYEMSDAYGSLAMFDDDRRAKLIPLIKAEMSRRESSRSQTEVSEIVMA